MNERQRLGYPKGYQFRHYYLCLLLAAFPLLKLSWISVPLFLLFCNALVFIFRFKPHLKWGSFFLHILVFLVYLVFLLRTSNLPDGWFIVQKKLGFILLALPFAIPELIIVAGERRTTIFLVFSFATILQCVITNLYIVFKGLIVDNPVNSDRIYFYRVSFDTYGHFHPTYMCAALFTCALIQLNELLKESGKRKPLPMLLICLCLVQAFFLSARMPFIAFGLSSFLLLVLLKQGKALAVFLLFCVFYCIIVLSGNRMGEMSTFSSKPGPKDYSNTLNLRTDIYDCGYSLFMHRWLSGYGTGNVQIQLNECLTARSAVFEGKNYNSHNEFLNIGLTAGIGGMLVLLFYLGMICKASVSGRNYLLLSYTVFIFICLLSENYFERIQGVVLFAFLPLKVRSIH
jgi:hypothetical protein